MRRREFRLARTAVLATIVLSMFVAVAANRNDVVQAEHLTKIHVSITSDGAERQVKTAQTTVGATLKDSGIEVGPLDKVTPATNERLSEGMKIVVVHVREAVEVVRQPIAFETVKTFTRGLGPGRVKVTTDGAPGEKLVRYLVRYEDGVRVGSKLVSAEVSKPATNKVVSIGYRGHYTSRGAFRSRKVMRMSASAYDPGPRSCGPSANGRTSCGLRAGYGVVAIDPSVIRMGTKLYVEGYGYAIAGDRGRAIKGNRIDLGYDTYREAIRFGRKSVIVHVLE